MDAIVVALSSRHNRDDGQQGDDLLRQLVARAHMGIDGRVLCEIDSTSCCGWVYS